DAATSAFETLWRNVKARLAEPAPAAKSEQRRSATFPKTILDLIAKLVGEPAHDAVRDEAAIRTTPIAPAADAQSCPHRIRLEVHGEDAFESLRLKLCAASPPNTTRLAHIFDTDAGVLLRDG